MQTEIRNEKRKQKKPHHYPSDSTLTSSAFLFNIWTQFGCDNDAICRPFIKCTQKQYKSKPHMCTRSPTHWLLFCELWAARCCRAVLAPSSHFKFSSSFPNFSERFGIGPPGPFSKHIEDFMLPSSANIISQLFWQWCWCKSRLMDSSYYFRLV